MDPSLASFLSPLRGPRGLCSHTHRPVTAAGQPRAQRVGQRWGADPPPPVGALGPIGSDTETAGQRAARPAVAGPQGLSVRSHAGEHGRPRPPRLPRPPSPRFALRQVGRGGVARPWLGQMHLAALPALPCKWALCAASSPEAVGLSLSNARWPGFLQWPRAGSAGLG